MPTNSILVRAIVASFLTVKAAAMDIVIDKSRFHCESRPVKVDLSYFCDQNSVCNVGRDDQLIKGNLTYYGLKDMFGATKADSLKINAYANLNMLPGYVKRQQLMTMVPVSLCGSQVASAYNSNGACPSDGTYSFETMFQMDSPNDFSAWMKTGYRGEATVTMYLDTTMSVVGRCTFGIRTKPSVPIPSAMFVITMLVLSFSVYVGYVITRHLRPQWLPKYLQRNKNTEELLPYDHQFRNVLPPYKQKEQPQPLIEESRW